MNIQTTGTRSTRSLGLDSPECHEYQPANYQDLFTLLKKITITSSDVFLDVGSGMGRTVFMVATRKLKRVVGVEISTELSAIAEANLRHVRGVKSRIEFLNADIGLYKVPPDTTIIYINNSVHGSILETFLGNVLKSLSDNPHPLLILVDAPYREAKLCLQLASCVWLRKLHDLKLPSGRHGEIYTTEAT